MRFLLYFIASLLVLGCVPSKPKEKQKKDAPSSSLLDKNYGGSIDRFENNKKVLFSFKSTEPSYCKIKFWSQLGGYLPSKSNPKVHECSTSPISDRFEFSIDKLHPKIMYVFEINLWREGEKEANAEKTLVKEQEGGHTEILKDFKLESGSIQNLIVAKVNIPLASGDVYRHKLDTIQNEESISQLFTMNQGCHLKSSFEPFLGESQKLSFISSISTLGFYTGNSKKRPSEYEHLQLNFLKKKQPSDRWEWNYLYQSKSEHFYSKSPSVFGQVSLINNSKVELKQNTLSEGLDEIQLNSQSPLMVYWTLQNALENSYVVFQIGEPSSDQSLECIFDAKALSGEVDNTLLNQLPNGLKYININLLSYQFIKPNNPRAPGWVIATNDWRSIKTFKN